MTETKCLCQKILPRRTQHVFDEAAVASGGVIHEDMGHRADELSVLYNRRAGHADVK